MSRITFILSFLLAVALFAGCCSNLEIGVDVYNGPLVNQEEIQMQQLIGVVHGTHALLEELRDRLQQFRSSVDSKNLLELIEDALGTYDKDEFLAIVAELKDCMADMSRASTRIGVTDLEVVKFLRTVALAPVAKTTDVVLPAGVKTDPITLSYFLTRRRFLQSFLPLSPPRVTDEDKKFIRERLQEFETDEADVSNLKVVFYDRETQESRECQTLFKWAEQYAAFFGAEWKRGQGVLNARLPHFFAALEKALPPADAKAYQRIKARIEGRLRNVLEAVKEIYGLYQQYDILREQASEAINRRQKELLEAKNNIRSTAAAQTSKPSPEQVEQAVARATVKGWSERDAHDAMHFWNQLPTPVAIARDEPPGWIQAQGRLHRALEAVTRLNTVGSPGRGKNYKGLDQLTRAYIMEPAGEYRIRRRRELLLELARFGEKLRMLGTYNKALLEKNYNVLTAKPATSKHTTPNELPPDLSEVEQAMFFLESIGNHLVTAADAAFTRDRKRIRSIIQVYEGAQALQSDTTFANRPPCLKQQIDRLEPWVERIRQGEIPYEILVLWENHEDSGGLYALTTRLRMELVGVLKASTDQAHKDKATALKAALQEILDQRSDISDISPARDFLRTVDASPLQKKDRRIWAPRADEALVRRMIEVVERHMWRNINTVELSASGKADYVVVKDAIGNWYIKSYSNDPSELIAAAFGGAKAVAEFALAAKTGGTSEALKGFLTNVVEGKAAPSADAEMVRRQLESAWASYESSKLKAQRIAHKGIVETKPKIKDRAVAQPLEDVFTKNGTTKDGDVAKLTAKERNDLLSEVHKKTQALIDALFQAEKALAGIKEPTAQDAMESLASDKKAVEAARISTKNLLTQAVAASKVSLGVFTHSVTSIAAGIPGSKDSSQGSPSLPPYAAPERK